MTTSNKAPSATYKIWIAGDYADACRAIREYCQANGDCFSVVKTDFIFSGGSEAGVCVTRINYPRFPAEPKAIYETTATLAAILKHKLYQKSYSIEGPSETIWFTDADE